MENITKEEGMKIIRELKGATFSFDDEAKEMEVTVWEHGRLANQVGTIGLNKTLIFSLFRFMIRATQRMGRKKRKEAKI